jgi:hypothetical protein
VGATSGKPSYFVPVGLVNQISAIDVYSSDGGKLDTMKLQSKKTGQYVTKSLSSAALAAANQGVVVKTTFKSGLTQCEVLGSSLGNYD